MPNRTFRQLRQGFSLIEVMVAMTILSIIVLIVAGIFQQTGLAWSIGLKRADAQSVTRALVGTLGRDLAMMVDPNNFGILDANHELQATESYDDTNLGGNLTFYILRPTQDAKALILNSGDVNKRELVKVSYSGGSTVTRTAEPVEGGATERTSYRLSDGSVTFRAVKPGNDASEESSAYDAAAIEIKIRPQQPPTINDYEIAAGSCGPDGKWGTEDDIRSWPENEDN